MNSCSSSSLSACAPPLITFSIGVGSTCAFGPPSDRHSGIPCESAAARATARETASIAFAPRPERSSVPSSSTSVRSIDPLLVRVHPLEDGARSRRARSRPRGGPPCRRTGRDRRRAARGPRARRSTRRTAPRRARRRRRRARRRPRSWGCRGNRGSRVRVDGVDQGHRAHDPRATMPPTWDFADAPVAGAVADGETRPWPTTRGPSTAASTTGRWTTRRGRGRAASARRSPRAMLGALERQGCRAERCSTSVAAPATSRSGARARRRPRERDRPLRGRDRAGAIARDRARPRGADRLHGRRRFDRAARATRRRRPEPRAVLLPERGPAPRQLARRHRERSTRTRRRSTRAPSGLQPRSGCASPTVSFRLRRKRFRGFRAFVHDLDAVDRAIADAGFRRVRSSRER